MAERLLKIAEVRRLVSLHRVTIYKWIKRGQFPSPVRIGLRNNAWRESEIAEWIAARPKVRSDGSVK